MPSKGPKLDDPIQSDKATELLESLSASTPGFVSLVSVVEMVWILQACYSSIKSEIVILLETMLRTRELTFERSELIWQALRKFVDTRADFADWLSESCAHHAGCVYVATFDTRVARMTGMRLLA